MRHIHSVRKTGRPRSSRLDRPNERGFVLPAALFVLVTLSTIAVAAMYGAMNEQRSASAALWRSQAFYVAEAGLKETYANWPTAAEALEPGAVLDLGWTSTRPHQSRYHVVIRRADDGTNPRRTFVISSTGESPAPGSGATTVLRLFTRQVFPIFSVPGAVAGSGDDATLENNALINGMDEHPAGWDPVCYEDPNDVPGLAWPDASGVNAQPPSDIDGDPPVVEQDPDGLFDLYDELADKADITFPGPGEHKIEENLGPATFGGGCDTGVDTNWGAPTDLSHVCNEHFPIIHAQGDLKLEGNNLPSQGILLIDGDLQVEDNLDFYGLVMIKGDGGVITLKGENSFNVYGAVVVGGDFKLENNTQVRYSSCVLRRVGKAIGFPEEVTRLSFVEAF